MPFIACPMVNSCLYANTVGDSRYWYLWTWHAELAMESFFSIRIRKISGSLFQNGAALELPVPL